MKTILVALMTAASFTAYGLEIESGESAPEKRAAAELKTYVSLLAEEEPDARFRIGVKFLVEFPDDKAMLGDWDGYAVRRKDGFIYIVSPQPRGCLFAVYDFLERNSDIIWARPDEDCGTIYTRTKTFDVREADFVERPKFQMRGWWFCGPQRHAVSESGREKFPGGDHVEMSIAAKKRRLGWQFGIDCRGMRADLKNGEIEANAKWTAETKVTKKDYEVRCFPCARRMVTGLFRDGRRWRRLKVNHTHIDWRWRPCQALVCASEGFGQFPGGYGVSPPEWSAPEWSGIGFRPFGGSRESPARRHQPSILRRPLAVSALRLFRQWHRAL